MSWKTVLRQYATHPNPEKLPNALRFSHNETSITIFDTYPKSIFHFLILARPTGDLSANALADLRTLLRCDKQQAKAALQVLKQASEELQLQIEKEMLRKYGFKWGIWTGFHAVPSMSHLHLHVISSDLNSPALKNKKHYNSFHPKLGFFLHLDDVLEWFEATETRWAEILRLNEKQFEPLLKEPLQCWRCEEVAKTVPAMKTHLKDHFETDLTKASKKKERLEAGKRKRDSDDEGQEVSIAQRHKDE